MLPPVPKVKFYTAAGCGALVIWTLTALIVSELDNIPLFETSALIFAASFAAIALHLTYTKQWECIKNQPLSLWVVGVFGICGSDIAYINAIKSAPAAHVDLIDYLWPFLVIVFTGFLPKESFQMKYLIAGIFGLIGVFVLLTGGEGLSGFKPEFYSGYWWALGGALIWSSYTVYTRIIGDSPTAMIGMFCGVGALLTLIAHFMFEVPTPLTNHQIGLGIFQGLSSSGLAYILWDYGIKKGNLRLLGTLTYLTPMISMGLLVYFEKEPMSQALVVACVLVSIGVMVGSVDWGKLKSKFIKIL